MKIGIEVPNVPTNDRDIASLSEEVGLAFPELYREFLVAQNGGVPEKGIFHYGNGNSSGVVFFGVNTGENYNDLKWNLEVYKTRIPDGFFPIGNDPGGNLICIDLCGDHKVYFWDHEQEENPPTRNNVFQLAGSLEEFLDILEPDEDGEDW